MSYAKEQIQKFYKKRKDLFKWFKVKDEDVVTKGLEIQDNGTLEIDHVKSLEEMVRIINMVPMSDSLKGLLVYRLTHPGIEMLRLAERFGVRFQKILEMEEEAKEAVKEFLKKHDSKDLLNKFNHSSNRSKRNDLKNKLVNPFIRQPENSPNPHKEAGKEK